METGPTLITSSALSCGCSQPWQVTHSLAQRAQWSLPAPPQAFPPAVCPNLTSFKSMPTPLHLCVWVTLSRKELAGQLVCAATFVKVTNSFPTVVRTSARFHSDIVTSGFIHTFCDIVTGSDWYAKLCPCTWDIWWPSICKVGWMNICTSVLVGDGVNVAVVNWWWWWRP